MTVLVVIANAQGPTRVYLTTSKASEDEKAGFKPVPGPDEKIMIDSISNVLKKPPKELRGKLVIAGAKDTADVTLILIDETRETIQQNDPIVMPGYKDQGLQAVHTYRLNATLALGDRERSDHHEPTESDICGRHLSVRMWTLVTEPAAIAAAPTAPGASLFDMTEPGAS